MERQETVESELSHELARSFRAAHLLREQLAVHLPPGLEPAAVQLLLMLVKQGPARANELAGQTFLDPSTVSRRVSQLVAHALVERQADPADGRAVRLAATAEGATLVGHVRDARDRITRGALGDWDVDDIHTLIDLLRRYNDAVDGHRRQTTTGGDT